MKKTKKALSAVYWELETAIRDEELVRHNASLFFAPEKSVFQLVSAFAEEGFSGANVEHAKSLLELYCYLSGHHYRLENEQNEEFKVSYSYACAANIVWGEISLLFFHPDAPHRNPYIEVDAETNRVSVKMQ